MGLLRNDLVDILAIFRLSIFINYKKDIFLF